MNELLALLGRFWSRLLLYPGGLSAFALVAIIGVLPRIFPRVRGQGLGFQSSRVPESYASPGPWCPGTLEPRTLTLRISAIIMPWLGLSFLPLPMAASLDRPIDIVAVLALLEWPLLLFVAVEIHAPCEHRWRTMARRLAAVLNGYPVLLMALLLLALSGGTFEIATFVQAPDANANVVTIVLHWMGAATLTFALPAMCGFGPFATQAPLDPALRIGLRLRTIGFVLLAALPWLPLINAPDWLQPLPPLLIALLLWIYHLLTVGGQARRWAYSYLVLATLQLLALLSAAIAALQTRLV